MVFRDWQASSQRPIIWWRAFSGWRLVHEVSVGELLVGGKISGLGDDDSEEEIVPHVVVGD
jgi:hypothetical protein